MWRRIAILAVVFALDPASLAAQTGEARPRLVEGLVQRPGARGRPDPVVGQWIVLHRVGSDRAAPLDSVRSGAGGRFRFRYAAFGAADALYFVSATYGGIAYFSAPLRTEVVRGGDADIMVYDITSDTTELRMQGKHLVVSLPRGSKREIAEIFEIENTGVRTVTARDSIAVWSTTLPDDADSVAVAPGDVSAGAVSFRRGRAELYAPLSPGVRQLVLTYSLPAESFPISLPVERATSVLEVLMEDPRGDVAGAGLAEVAAAAIEGRTFRRFTARDVPASAVVRVNAPAPARENRAALRVLLAVLAAAMICALLLWLVKGKRATFSAGRAASRVERQPSDVERLVAEIAALDARHERERQTPESRGAYERERADLKSRVAAALAAENERI